MIKKLLALSLTLAMAVSLTGCVKVVKIGEEAQLTGKQEFNATDSVQGMWESAEANIEEKAVDLPAFLGEAGYGNLGKHQLCSKRLRRCGGGQPGEKGRLYDRKAGRL